MVYSLVCELLRRGYPLFGRKITRMTAGIRERYLLHLPESDNDVWKLLRERGVRINLYIEISRELLEKIRMPRSSGRRVTLMSRTSRERYIVYLPEGFNGLWG